MGIFGIIGIREPHRAHNHIAHKNDNPQNMKDFMPLVGEQQFKMNHACKLCQSYQNQDQSIENGYFAGGAHGVTSKFKVDLNSVAII